LLFSAYETWMVKEHRVRGFDDEWLNNTYALASVGNGLMAILAGIVAQITADALGEIGPFQLAIALTVLDLVLVLGWTENYGGSGDNDTGNETGSSYSGLFKNFRDSIGVIASSLPVFLLGSVCALFEGGMFSFVFQWVPTMFELSPQFPDRFFASNFSVGPVDFVAAAAPKADEGSNVPTGLVFSSLMVCITVGGLLIEPIIKQLGTAAASLAVYTTAAAAMFIAYQFNTFYPTLAAFLLFEVCVGAFFPASAGLRSEFLPTSLQATIMTLFRIPLSLLVCVGTKLDEYVDHKVQDGDYMRAVGFKEGFQFERRYVFLIIASWMALAAVLQLFMLWTRPEQAASKPRKSAAKEVAEKPPRSPKSPRAASPGRKSPKPKSPRAASPGRDRKNVSKALHLD